MNRPAVAPGDRLERLMTDMPVWMDYHLHSSDSPDSGQSMAEVCRRAVELGLTEICFTEHYDTDPYDMGFRYHDEVGYDARLAAVRREFAGRLVVRKGLEVDFQSRHARRAAEEVSRWRFDYVLGAVHCAFGDMVHLALGRGFPPEEVYRQYFAELRALVATGMPNCLAHLDYVRKVGHKLMGDYRYPDFDREMADLMPRLVRAGIGLEVNSRHLDKGQPVVPSVEVLRMYRGAGGRIVTLGSDAHRVEGVGSGLELGCRMLREAGFTEYMSFDAGRPTAVPLPECG